MLEFDVYDTYLFMHVIAGVVAAIIFGQISRRLGYPWLLGAFVAIPGINVCILLYLIIARSPNEKRLAELEREYGQTLPSESDVVEGLLHDQRVLPDKLPDDFPG